MDPEAAPFVPSETWVGKAERKAAEAAEAVKATLAAIEKATFEMVALRVLEKKIADDQEQSRRNRARAARIAQKKKKKSGTKTKERKETKSETKTKETKSETKTKETKENRKKLRLKIRQKKERRTGSVGIANDKNGSFMVSGRVPPGYICVRNSDKNTCNNLHPWIYAKRVGDFITVSRERQANVSFKCRRDEPGKMLKWFQKQGVTEEKMSQASDWLGVFPRFNIDLRQY